MENQTISPISHEQQDHISHLHLYILQVQIYHHSFRIIVEVHNKYYSYYEMDTSGKSRSRRSWVTEWIGRRRKFGIYDQLMVELRNEDQALFTASSVCHLTCSMNFGQSRFEDQQKSYKFQRAPGAWLETFSDVTSPSLREQVFIDEVCLESSLYHNFSGCQTSLSIYY